MNKYVLIRKHSAGNESVGEMWDETIIFDGSTTLDEVMDWGMDKCSKNLGHSRQTIIITKPHLNNAGNKDE